METSSYDYFFKLVDLISQKALKSRHNLGENMPLGQPPHMIVCNTSVLMSSRNAPPHKRRCVTTLKVGVNYAHDEWFPYVLKKIVHLTKVNFYIGLIACDKRRPQS